MSDSVYASLWQAHVGLQPFKERPASGPNVTIWKSANSVVQLKNYIKSTAASLPLDTNPYVAVAGGKPSL